MTENMDIEGRPRPARVQALDAESLRRVTQRGVAEIIEEREFVQLLQAGKPLRLKMGFDPSAPDIHWGTWWGCASCGSSKRWVTRWCSS